MLTRSRLDCTIALEKVGKPIDINAAAEWLLTQPETMSAMHAPSPPAAVAGRPPAVRPSSAAATAAARTSALPAWSSNAAGSSAAATSSSSRAAASSSLWGSGAAGLSAEERDLQMALELSKRESSARHAASSSYGAAEASWEALPGPVGPPPTVVRPPAGRAAGVEAAARAAGRVDVYVMGGSA